MPTGEQRLSTRCQSKQALICRIQNHRFALSPRFQRLGWQANRIPGAVPQAKPDVAPSALNERWVLEFGAGYSRTSAQSIPMVRFSAKRFSDFGKIRYRASLLSLKPTIPKSVPLSLFRIVITWAFLICDWRWRSAGGFCHSVQTCGLPQFSIIWEKRAVLILRSFIANHWIGAGVTRLTKKKARQRTTARRIILPLLHSCPGGICKSSIHSP
jgi:hypothetical protein